jgi:hypothetical protein
MDEIRRVGTVCVGRAVFFGTLAIGCVMVGFSFNPVTSFRSGAVLTLIMATILLWKAYAATGQNPKTTEMWLYLDEGSRPAEAQAKMIVGTVMREIYGWFGQMALLAAVAFFVVSLALVGLGFEPLHRAELAPRASEH